MFPRVGDKRRIDDINLEDEEAIGSLCRMSGRPLSPKTAMEQEKRLRREIANSNERRRMQSINAGFASLKTLLPHHEGEKLSKAAILQQTADYIYSLEKEKASLLSQYCQMKRLLNQQHHSDTEGSQSGGDSPCEDRNASTPPGSTSLGGGGNVNSSGPLESVVDELRKELMENRTHLDRERRARKNLEDHIKVVEAKLNCERKEKRHSQSRTCPSSPLEVKEDSFSPVGSPHPDILEEVKIEPDLDHIEVPQAVTTTNQSVSSDASSRIDISASSPQSIISTTRCNSGQLQQAYIAPPATFVTVVPTTKALNKNISPVLELRRVSDIDSSQVPASTDTFYIVNPSNACQNSPLDTICEAIRHLEGDNMFAPEDQHPRIEEEIITEETYTVEEESHQSVPQNLHLPPPGSIVSAYDTKLIESSPTSESNFNSVNISNNNSNPINNNVYQTHTTHPLGGSLGHLTLHMIQPEPQEAPLELTTTHRSSTDQKCVKEIGLVQTRQVSIPHSDSNSLVTHNTRPGVIVVKQP